MYTYIYEYIAQFAGFVPPLHGGAAGATVTRHAETQINTKRRPNP